MTTIVKRTVKGVTYYYLEHTIRDKDRFKQKSKYLGKAIPKDIDEIKRQFEFELNKERWFDEFDSIKKNYHATLQAYPESTRKKELQTFSVQFTYDTQRIEGSTLSLRETAQLLGEGISPGARPVEDIKEAEAHQKVFFEMLRCEGIYRFNLCLIGTGSFSRTPNPTWRDRSGNTESGLQGAGTSLHLL